MNTFKTQSHVRFDFFTFTVSFQGRIKARQKKMQHIARLLDIPGQSGPPSPAFVGAGIYANRGAGRGYRDNRPLFNNVRVPGFAAPRRESLPGVAHKADAERRRKDSESPNRLTVAKKESTPNNGATKRETRSRESSSGRNKSREGSPRMPRPKSEEIPLELIKKGSNVTVDVSSKISILPRPQVARVENEPSASGDSQNNTPKASTSSNTSEETSFIADKGSSSPRKKGIVETI